MASVEIPGLLHPEGLALTSEGRLFVADRDARKIWAVDSSGAVSVFAGSGDGPFAEGAAATSAGLKAPEALALGPDGSVYISDSGDHRVSRVTPDGIIHTVAGTGEVGLAEKGKAISARLAGPEGVAVDSDGTVYISDSMNHRLVRVDKNGDLEPVSGGPDPGLPLRDPLYLKDIEEWAGAAKYYEPAGLAFDGQGNLYIADRRNHRIRVIANVAAARFGPEPASAPGDVNGDGKVDVKDVVLTLQVAVKSAVFTDLQAAAADVAPHPGASGRPYGDGKVDVSDAARLLRRVLGFIPTEWP